MTFKKRFIALAVVLVLAFIGSVIYVATDGGTYTHCLQYYRNDFITDKDLSVVTDNKDIVKADRVYLNDDHLICVDMHSTGHGSAKLTVTIHCYFEDENGNPDYYFQKEELPIYVDSFGTVFEKKTLDFDGYLFIEIEILVSLALVLLVMAYSFIESFLKARFSYSMVAFGGIALFCAFVLTITIYEMQWMNTFENFLNNLLDTGYQFAILTSPFMMAFSIAFAISNIWLIRREGFRLQNMLGIGLAVLWFSGLVLIELTFVKLIDLTSYSTARNICYSMGYVVSFMECMLLSTVAAAFLSSKRKAPFDRNYLIILGCCIRKDGTLTPILKGRADAAIRFERAQFAATGNHAKFVPSGGQGADEVISESEAMARYLKEQGYPDEQIIKEDKSVNTYQNIRFSRDKILQDAGSLNDVRAGIATTNYHVFRSYVLAKKHGLPARGISAKTKWYFFPNAFLREFVGLIVDRKFKIAAIIIALLAAYTIAVHLLSMGVIF